MKSNFKVYFINLDKSVQRREFMEQQLDKLGVNYTRITAVDGSKIDAEEIDEIKKTLSQKNEHYTLPKVGEIGVYYSHFKVWEQIIDQEEEFALVLEDDALLDEKLFEDIEEICTMLDSLEIIDISGIKGFLALEKRKIKEDISMVRFTTPSLRALGNIIGKKAAKVLLETFPIYIVPIDNMMQQVYKHQLKIWTTTNSYAQINDKNLGGSTIQTKNETKKEKIRKEIVRPFYRLKINLLNIKYEISKLFS